jgi:hypothetical protein
VAVLIVVVAGWLALQSFAQCNWVANMTSLNRPLLSSSENIDFGANLADCALNQ